MQIEDQRTYVGEREITRENLVTRCYDSGGYMQVYMQPMCGGRGLHRSNRRCVQSLDMYGLCARGSPAVS